MSQGSMIKDGIEDQHGCKWLGVGDEATATWMPMVAFHNLQSVDIARMARAGVTVLTTAAKEKLKVEAQAFASYRRVDIASKPGWTADTFVHRDGSHRTCAGSTPVLVAYDGDERYVPKASFKAYQMASGPLIRDQPLILIAFAFGFVGPLMRFAPTDMQNPVIELVGETEQGKTSLTSSVATLGGGSVESWNFTRNNLDDLRAPSRDGLLVLDEANLAGRTRAERAQVIGDAVFKLVEKGGRKRFGEPCGHEPMRHATLSTSNSSLLEFIGADTTEGRANVTRVLTLRCDRAYGIFDAVPDGYTSAKSAVEALTKAAHEHFGAAGHALIRGLCQFEAVQIKRVIERTLNRPDTLRVAGLAPNARTSKIVAMTYVAAKIATQFEIIPGAVQDLEETFSSVLKPRKCAVTRTPAGLERIRSYVAANRDRLIPSSHGDLPFAEARFDATPGFWIDEHRSIIVSTKYLQAELPLADEVLRELREYGRLDADPGKFSKKAPRSITPRGRAYFIDVA